MHEALNRTLLLMRDHLEPGVTDDELVECLATTTVAIRCHRGCAQTHAGQTALIALCALLARSGHRVYVEAPDVALIGPQPPARAMTLLGAIAEVAAELPTHPGTTLSRPPRADLEFLLGEAIPSGAARQTVWLAWGPWDASLASNAVSSNEPTWPIGALAAASLAAAEAFKLAMRHLARFALERRSFDAQYCETGSITIRLAPVVTPTIAELGAVDFISAGAIANSALYALLRLPNLRLSGRIFDDDSSALSNLNRNMLLLHRALGAFKARDLAAIAPKGMLDAVVQKFDHDAIEGYLAPRVLVGVDHIPSRWAAQRAAQGWVGIGATSHFNALVSVHPVGAACAGCMHPRDDQDMGPIPTVAFVSFWAGLLAAVELLCEAGGEPAAANERQKLICPLRPESLWRSAIAPRLDCPTPCSLAATA